MFGLTVGVAAGTLAGVYRGSIIDRAVTGIAIVGLSLPSFWVAILLLILFSAQWGILPAGGWGSDKAIVARPARGAFTEPLVRPSTAMKQPCGGRGSVSDGVRGQRQCQEAASPTLLPAAGAAPARRRRR